MKETTVIHGFQVPGFSAAGICCGIKTNKQKDLALIFSEEPAVAAGVFTANKIVSPTVTWCRKVLDSSKTFRAIVVNSGNANACNGQKGMKDCKSVASRLAQELSISPKEVLMASTGIIGVPLPSEKIIKSLFATFYFVILSIPLGQGFALAVAILMKDKIWGINFFRSAWYLPSVITGVGMAILWTWVFDDKSGFLNMPFFWAKHLRQLYKCIDKSNLRNDFN